MFDKPASRPSLTTLTLLSGLSVISLNMFLPSLTNIAGEFQADYALVNLSIAGYAAITAIMQIIAGPLSDRFGRRPVILGALAIFAIASVGCFLAGSIWSFLFWRMLQATVITGYAVSLAIIRDVSTAQRGASLMGYMAMAWALAPMLGPILGGSLDALFGWRASFAAFVLFGTAMLALCWFDLGETNHNRAATLTGQCQRYGELLGSRGFWGYSLCMAFSIGAFYAFLGGAPLVAAGTLGIPPASLGVYMAMTTAGFILGSFLSGRFASRFSLTRMIVLSRLIACSGLAAGLVPVWMGHISVLTVFGSALFAGIGNGMTLPSANAGALSVQPALAGSAAGLSGALTVAGGAVVSSITGMVVTQDNAPFALLSMMLLSSFLALVAVWFVPAREATPQDHS